jgi:predicted RNase H-like HicB family nuclease
MFSMEFDTIFFKEGSVIVAYCPELDVSSCGNDIEQARTNLKTAVRLFVEEAQKMGTLEDILEESGFTQSSESSWLPPRLVATELMSMAT